MKKKIKDILLKSGIKIFLIMSFIILSGCASVYVAPQTGDTAQLRILAPQFGGLSSLGVNYYDGKNCENAYMFGVLSILYSSDSDKKSNIPKSPDKSGSYFDRIVKAGEVNLGILGSFMNQRCSVAVSMILEKNNNYELEYYWSDKKCHVTLKKIIVDHKYIDIPLQKRSKSCNAIKTGNKE